MPYQASIEDWLSLLGVSTEVRGVFAGLVTVQTAKDALSAARTRWPGVNQDYVAVIDALSDQVDKLQDVLIEQEQLLDDLRGTIENIYETVPEGCGTTDVESVPAPLGRLLNAAERVALERISEQLDRIAEDVAYCSDEMEELADEAEAEADAAAERAAEEGDDAEDEEDGWEDV